MTSLPLLLSLMSCTLSSLFYYHCLTYILFSILSSVDGKDAESDVVQETDDDEDDQVQGRGHGKNSTKVPTKNKAIEVHDSDSEDA